MKRRRARSFRGGLELDPEQGPAAGGELGPGRRGNDEVLFIPAGQGEGESCELRTSGVFDSEASGSACLADGDGSETPLRNTVHQAAASRLFDGDFRHGQTLSREVDVVGTLIGVIACDMENRGARSRSRRIERDHQIGGFISGKRSCRSAGNHEIRRVGSGDARGQARMALT